MKLATCYYPEHSKKEEWLQDIKNMKEMGINTVRIFDSTWGLVEKKEGIYDFSLLNEIMDILENNHMDVILCTPTWSPPIWATKNYPHIRAYESEDLIIRSGTNKTYDFSSEKYQELSSIIVEKFAENFKKYQNIIGWQLDNEYTTMSYSNVSLDNFRKWLKNKYKTLDNLNQAWGSEFWSLFYTAWDEINFFDPRMFDTADYRLNPYKAPNNLGLHPSQSIDFYRYYSDTVKNYNKMQAQIIKKYYPNIPVTHNFNSKFPFIDKFELNNDLDVFSFNHYPLKDFINESEEAGISLDVDSQLKRGKYDDFSLNLNASVGKGNFWVSEIQTGSLNSSNYNPLPQAGMLRLWALECISYGASLISANAWNRSKIGYKQAESGLMLKNNMPSQGGLEYLQVSKDILALEQADFHSQNQAKVAFVYSYDGVRALIVQALSSTAHYSDITNAFYKAFIKLGVSVDFISPEDDLTDYDMIVITNSVVVNDRLQANLQTYKGEIILTPRTFSKDKNMHFSHGGLPPIGLENLIDVKVKQIETLPPKDEHEILYNNKEYAYKLYREQITTSNTAIGTFNTDFRKGMPAIINNNNITYFSCVPNCKLLVDFFQDMCNKLEITTVKESLPDNIKIKQNNNFIFAFNYGSSSVHMNQYLPENIHVIIGNLNLESTGILVAKITKD